ncbi:hypothetical protein Q604_UNBC08730G0001, partial [human gut metagenome]
IEDVDAENHEAYPGHLNEIKRILSFAIAA